MHKTKGKCSAANDSDDSSDGSEKRRRAKRQDRKDRTSQTSRSKKDAVGYSSSKKSAVVEKSPPRKKAKKEKEFAWMDSEDEEASDEEVKQDKQEKQETDNDEVTLEKLDAVERFGQMMVLQDSLHQKLKNGALGPPEIAAACRALARSRFFDGDILDDICKSLQKMINEDKLGEAETTDAIVCLKELNYYKHDVFAAIAKNFKPKIRMLSPVARATWLEVMQSLNHKSDRDFLQVLEILPLLPVNPGYRKVKCAFFAKDNTCALGESCTFAHNEFAPVSLDGTSSEDAWRRRSVIMTHEQKYVFKEKEFGQSFQQSRTASSSMGSMGPLPVGPLATMQNMINAFQGQR